MPQPGFFTCPQCGQDARPLGPKKKCPNCGMENLGVGFATAQDAGVPAFPERMKANKVLAGRICPGCSVAIELGQDAWNCPQCQGTMHQACHEAHGACRNSDCPSALQMAAAPAANAPTGASAAANTAAMKPCPYCGESVLKDARKCRFCGEMLDKAARLRQDRMKRQAAEDEKLSGTEILFGILCGWIACICGIVWMVQGKKKGVKLVLLTVAVTLVHILIRVVLLNER